MSVYSWFRWTLQPQPCSTVHTARGGVITNVAACLYTWKQQSSRRVSGVCLLVKNPHPGCRCFSLDCVNFCSQTGNSQVELERRAHKRTCGFLRRYGELLCAFIKRWDRCLHNLLGAVKKHTKKREIGGNECRKKMKNLQIEKETNCFWHLYVQKLIPFKDLIYSLSSFSYFVVPPNA